ncbi:MAG TPA: hypothetical protein VGF63_01435 [Solirubrobacteraceae bacterium]
MSGLFAREGFVVDQRTPCDCMRGAIATYLGVAYELTPDISGRHDADTFWSDWAEWLATCGLMMATFACAPGHLDRWIAIVGRTAQGPTHAVVMANTELLHDPAPPADRMVAVAREDILTAMVIGPLGDPTWTQRISEAMSADLAAGAQRTWCLERLMDAPWNVDLLRMRGQHDEADAMNRRLRRVVHRWPAAAIACDGQCGAAI